MLWQDDGLMDRWIGRSKSVEKKTTKTASHSTYGHYIPRGLRVCSATRSPVSCKQLYGGLHIHSIHDISTMPTIHRSEWVGLVGSVWCVKLLSVCVFFFFLLKKNLYKTQSIPWVEGQSLVGCWRIPAAKYVFLLARKKWFLIQKRAKGKPHLNLFGTNSAQSVCNLSHLDNPCNNPHFRSYIYALTLYQIGRKCDTFE